MMYGRTFTKIAQIFLICQNKNMAVKAEHSSTWALLDKHILTIFFETTKAMGTKLYRNGLFKDFY